MINIKQVYLPFIILLLVIDGCIVSDSTVTKEPDVSDLIFYLNSLSDAEYFSVSNGLCVDCDGSIFSVLIDTTWTRNDTVYNGFNLFCGEIEVVASGTHTNTLVYLNDKLIGYNVGRYYMVENQEVMDSIFRIK